MLAGSAEWRYRLRFRQALEDLVEETVHILDARQALRVPIEPPLRPVPRLAAAQTAPGIGPLTGVTTIPPAQDALSAPAHFGILMVLGSPLELCPGRCCSTNARTAKSRRLGAPSTRISWGA